METVTDIKESERESSMPTSSIRKCGPEEWMVKYGSGSLLKSFQLSMSWRDLYLKERVCHEWGWGFEILPRSRITFGDAIMEGDCHSLTEGVWHIKRMIDRSPFPDSDYYEAKYILIEYENKKREGFGVVLRQTSATWIPKGHIVFAIVSEYDTRSNQWMEAENPL